MKRIAAQTLALLLLGAGTASASIDYVGMFETPCGDSPACHEPTGSTDYDDVDDEDPTPNPCETSTWGDASAGGATTVCEYDDGTNTWNMSEWGDGWMSSVTGKATSDGLVTESSTDYQCSADC